MGYRNTFLTLLIFVSCSRCSTLFAEATESAQVQPAANLEDINIVSIVKEDAVSLDPSEKLFQFTVKLSEDIYLTNVFMNFRPTHPAATDPFTFSATPYDTVSAEHPTDTYRATPFFTTFKTSENDVYRLESIQLTAENGQVKKITIGAQDTLIPGTAISVPTFEITTGLANLGPRILSNSIDQASYALDDTLLLTLHAQDSSIKSGRVSIASEDWLQSLDVNFVGNGTDTVLVSVKLDSALLKAGRFSIWDVTVLDEKGRSGSLRGVTEEDTYYNTSFKVMRFEIINP